MNLTVSLQISFSYVSCAIHFVVGYKVYLLAKWYITTKMELNPFYVVGNPRIKSMLISIEGTKAIRK